MRCINCGNEINSGAKFCRSCGQNQLEPVTSSFVEQEPTPAEQKTYEPVPEQAPSESKIKMPKMPDMSKVSMPDMSKVNMPDVAAMGQKAQDALKNVDVKNINADSIKKIPRFAKIAAAAVLAIAIIAGVFLNTTEMVVLRAVNKTVGEFESGVEDYVKDVDILNFFDGISKSELSVVAETGGFISGYNMEFCADFGDNKAMLMYDGDDYAEIYASEDLLAFSKSARDDVYGISFKTLENDLKNTELEIFEDIDLDGADLDYKNIYNDIVDVYDDAITNFIKNDIDIEKTGESTSFKINGSKVSAKSYNICLDLDELYDVLIDATDEAFENDDLIAVFEAYIELVGGGGDISYLQREVEYSIGGMLDALFEITDDGEFLVHISGGQIVAITSETRTQYVEILLNPDGNIFESITFTVENLLTDNVTEYELSSELDGDDFELEFNYVSGSSKRTLIAIDYDMGDTDDNLDISIYGEGSYSLSVDSSAKNMLVLETSIFGSSVEVTMEKNNLSKDWFDRGEEFINLLTLTEDDYNEAMGVSIVSSKSESSATTSSTDAASF